MKIFATYLRLELIQKPEWFDNFRLKYDQSFDLHITLTQPRYIDEYETDNLKNIVAKFINKHKFTAENKVVEFKTLVCDQEQDGKYTLMLLLEDTNAIFNFQKELRGQLNEFVEYVDKNTIKYEVDFKPHITVGTNVTPDLLVKARSYFQASFSVKGALTDMVLPIVKDVSVEERKNQNNLNIFNI